MTERAIWLAGGCFWGVERYLGRIPGVRRTTVGYANGVTPRPTYDEVCTGRTGYAETVAVAYDDTILDLGDLLALFLDVIDPTTVDQQGHDVGTQYRTGIFYDDPADRPIALAALAEVQARLTAPVVVEVAPLTGFWPAEDYHQRYLDQHPNGYCHISPTVFDQVATKAAYIRQIRTLTPLQHAVTQHDATEPPFQNAYDTQFAPGI